MGFFSHRRHIIGCSKMYVFHTAENKRYVLPKYFLSLSLITVHSLSHIHSKWVFILPLDWQLDQKKKKKQTHSEYMLLNHLHTPNPLESVHTAIYVATMDSLTESLMLPITESPKLTQHPRGSQHGMFYQAWHTAPGILLPQYLYLTTLYNFNTFGVFCTCGHKGKAVMGPGPLMGKKGSQSWAHSLRNISKPTEGWKLPVEFQGTVHGHFQEQDIMKGLETLNWVS